MVAFIVHASVGMQDNLMDALPKQVSVSPLPYAAQIDQKLDDMRADEETAEMLEGLDIPRLSDYQTIEVNMDSEGSDFDVEISDELLEKMENSDVTTIVGVCKEMTSDIFAQVKPKLISRAAEGMGTGLVTMSEKAQELQQAHDSLAETIAQLEEADAAIPGLFDEAEANYLASIDDNAEQIQQVYQQTLNGGFRGMAIFVAIVALIGLLVLVPYKDNRPGQKNEVIEV